VPFGPRRRSWSPESQAPLRCNRHGPGTIERQFTSKPEWRFRLFQVSGARREPGQIGLQRFWRHHIDFRYNAPEPLQGGTLLAVGEELVFKEFGVCRHILYAGEDAEIMFGGCRLGRCPPLVLVARELSSGAFCSAATAAPRRSIASSHGPVEVIAVLTRKLPIANVHSAATSK
jgi:hypothetical protein